jgi:cytochrome c553
VGNRGAANGALVVSLDAPLAGPAAVSNAAHEVEPRGLLSSATLCGTCHEVHGPGLLEEPTLTEFSGSRFSASDDCITCHTNSRAPRGEGRHALVGVDPRWGAHSEDDAAASTALWARALTLELRRVDDDFELTLTNSGGGHAVPTGATHLRDVWVDVEVIDGAGWRVTVPRVLELGARLTREGSEVALVTDATRVEPRGLAPGEARAIRIAVPRGLSAPVRAVARLSARAVRVDALVALGLESRAAEVPTLAVAEVSAP